MTLEGLRWFWGGGAWYTQSDKALAPQIWPATTPSHPPTQPTASLPLVFQPDRFQAPPVVASPGICPRLILLVGNPLHRKTGVTSHKSRPRLRHPSKRQVRPIDGFQNKLRTAAPRPRALETQKGTSETRSPRPENTRANREGSRSARQVKHGGRRWERKIDNAAKESSRFSTLSTTTAV
jgi:hypothetical protein